MSFMQGVLENLTADLLAWVIVGGFVYLFAVYRVTQRRHDLFQFFGLSKDEPTVHIFVSTINVKPDGATMIGGEDWPSFEHPTISAREFIVLPTFEQTFNFPLLDKMSEFMKDRPGFRRLWPPSIKVLFAPSPAYENDLPSGTLVLFGSRLVNIGTRYYQDNQLTIVGFDFDEHELVIERGSNREKRIVAESETVDIHGGRRPTEDLIVIERLYDHERERTVFIISGTGSNGTMAGALYLAANWRRLYEKYGDSKQSAFAIVLKCYNRRKKETGYRNPEFVADYKI